MPVHEPDPSRKGHRIAVAIVTFRRPDQLRQAISSVLPQIEAFGGDCRLVVVDNDVDESARTVVDEFRDGVAPLQWVSEPRPGLAWARNAALDAVSDCRLLAFIDDDEQARPGWLTVLVDGWSNGEYAAVTGPVVYQLPDDADEWARHSGYFEQPTPQESDTVDVAATNNLLLDLEVVRANGLRFDQRFALTGGEDAFFTRQLVAAGGRIRWRDDAVLDEVVIPQRATRAWVIQRDLRTASTWVRVHLALVSGRSSRAKTRCWCFAVAMKLLIIGSTATAIGLLSRDPARTAQGQRLVVRARGVLYGLRGQQIEEYART